MGEDPGVVPVGVDRRSGAVQLLQIARLLIGVGPKQTSTHQRSTGVFSIGTD